MSLISIVIKVYAVNLMSVGTMAPADGLMYVSVRIETSGITGGSG